MSESEGIPQANSATGFQHRQRTFLCLSASVESRGRSLPDPRPRFLQVVWLSVCGGGSMKQAFMRQSLLSCVPGCTASFVPFRVAAGLGKICWAHEQDSRRSRPFLRKINLAPKIQHLLSIGCPNPGIDSWREILHGALRLLCGLALAIFDLTLTPIGRTRTNSRALRTQPDADEPAPGAVDTGAGDEAVRGPPDVQREDGRGACLLQACVGCLVMKGYRGIPLSLLKEGKRRVYPSTSPSHQTAPGKSRGLGTVVALGGLVL